MVADGLSDVTLSRYYPFDAAALPPGAGEAANQPMMSSVIESRKC